MGLVIPHARYEPGLSTLATPCVWGPQRSRCGESTTSSTNPSSKLRWNVWFKADFVDSADIIDSAGNSGKKEQLQVFSLCCTWYDYLLFRLSNLSWSPIDFLLSQDFTSWFLPTQNLKSNQKDIRCWQLHSTYALPSTFLTYPPSIYNSLALTFPSPPSTCVLPPHFPPLHISLFPPTHNHSQVLRDWHMVLLILFLTGVSAVILIFMEGFDMYIANPVRDQNSVSPRNVSWNVDIFMDVVTECAMSIPIGKLITICT